MAVTTIITPIPAGTALPFSSGAPLNTLAKADGTPIDPASSADIAALIAASAQQTIYLAGSALAPLASLAVGASTAPVLLTATALYGWSAAFTGTSTLQLRFLLADGVTPLDVTGGSLSVNGFAEVKLFAGVSGVFVLLKNTGANPLTNITSALVS